MAEGPLQDKAQFKGVAPELEEVAQEGGERGQRERGREQADVAELRQHLQVLGERAVVLQRFRCR